MGKKELDVEHEYKILGDGIRKKLDKLYLSYGIPEKYTVTFNCFGAKARNLGFALHELVDKLEEDGYVKVIMTPGSRQFVFSGNCELSIDEMREKAMEEVSKIESEKEAKKIARAM